MAAVLIYSTPWCPFCVRAKQLLASKQAQVTDIDISSDGALRQQMIERSGRRTVPQIWVGETHVGGCDELFALERQGQLDRLLAG